MNNLPYPRGRASNGGRGVIHSFSSGGFILVVQFKDGKNKNVDGPQIF